MSRQRKSAMQDAPVLARDIPPITFRPVNQTSRALIDAVAAYEGTSLSRFVAQAMDEYVRAFVEEEGLEKIVAANVAAAKAREDDLAHSMAALISHPDLVPRGSKHQDPETAV